MNDAALEELYCQFGKRFLDGFSWLAPLTNNRLGDALNIEFVHEQLFFIQGNRVLDNVGYSEKGARFNEAQFGKPIHSLEDLGRNGYWLVGRRFHPDAVHEALAEQEDGYYYSFFSNQCQDWADRLKRRIERVEKTRGVEPLGSERGAWNGQGFWRERAPTVPASFFLGIVAILLGVGACLAPMIAAQKSVIVLALFFIASGAADVVYALHGHVWSQILQTIFFAMLNLLGGVALLLDTSVAATWAGILFGYALAVNGVSRIVVALRSRPLKNWLVSLLAGFGLLIGAVLLLTRTVGERDMIFGLLVGVNLILGGASTIGCTGRHPARRQTTPRAKCAPTRLSERIASRRHLKCTIPGWQKKLIEQKHPDVTAWKNLEALLELRDCSVERLSAARYAGRL